MRAMNRFPVTIEDDGSVTWHGVDTGKTKVLDMSRKKGLIALHVSGHAYWSGIGARGYAEAKVSVYEFTETDDPRKIYLTELFGELEWKARGSQWRPEK